MASSGDFHDRILPSIRQLLFFWAFRASPWASPESTSRNALTSPTNSKKEAPTRDGAATVVTVPPPPAIACADPLRGVTKRLNLAAALAFVLATGGVTVLTLLPEWTMGCSGNNC
jgi:hypothetical protein